MSVNSGQPSTHPDVNTKVSEAHSPLSNQRDHKCQRLCLIIEPKHNLYELLSAFQDLGYSNRDIGKMRKLEDTFTLPLRDMSHCDLMYRFDGRPKSSWVCLEKY